MGSCGTGRAAVPQVGCMTTILIVDDEYVIAEILRLAFEDEGHVALTARSGQEGLEILQHAKADAVITDFMMPGMNGAEFARDIRLLPGLAHIPIILITGGHNSQASENAQVFSVIMDKPFGIDEMLLLVQNLVSR